ncbi:NADH dehydrogenase [ubiquinone] 1 alpha subcomplex subunit 2, partial [Glycine soja]
GSNGIERKSFEKHKRTLVLDVPVITCKLTHKFLFFLYPRAFVERNYKELKTLNPKLPILIRECSGVEPQLWSRYDLGVEKGIKLEGLLEAQIFKALEDLVNILLLNI